MCRENITLRDGAASTVPRWAGDDGEWLVVMVMVMVMAMAMAMAMAMERFWVDGVLITLGFSKLIKVFLTQK